MIKDDFTLDYFSDVNREEVMLEISYKGQMLCQLNKEKGVNNIEIEFYPFIRTSLEELENMKFSLELFLEILEEAKDALIKA
ncbi:hypothetical protein [Ignatzschineria sp. LJL83]